MVDAVKWHIILMFFTEISYFCSMLGTREFIDDVELKIRFLEKNGMG